MRPTEYMANWIISTTYEAIPDDAKQVAEETCFDCLGVMLAGSAQRLGNIIISYVGELGGRGEATVIPGGQRIPACNAALVNGTFAHALDFDDSSGFSHSASVLLPALLALAEKTAASGRDVLEAYIIGHEVGEALTPRDNTDYHTDYPYCKQSVSGRMGVTAACAKLLKLNQKQIQRALGIAGSMAAGLANNFGTMTKPLHAGLAARDGVITAELAARGWTAGEYTLEHPLGFVNAFLGEGQDLHKIISRLGNPFRIQDMVAIKKYPCGKSNHYTIDALLELMKEHHFDYRDVEYVEISQPYYSHYLDSYYSHYIDPENDRPDTGLLAKFSMTYNAAATLVKGKIDIETFSDDQINDPLILETMNKIRIHVLSKYDIADAKIEGQWSGGGSTGLTGKPVKVHLINGKVLQKIILPNWILGSSKNPWGFENIQRKFETNARMVLPEHKLEQTVRVWSKLAQVQDIRKAIADISMH